jgi:hypothetical protein
VNPVNEYIKQITYEREMMNARRTKKIHLTGILNTINMKREKAHKKKEWSR